MPKRKRPEQNEANEPRKKSKSDESASVAYTWLNALINWWQGDNSLNNQGSTVPEEPILRRDTKTAQALISTAKRYAQHGRKSDGNLMHCLIEGGSKADAVMTKFSKHYIVYGNSLYPKLLTCINGLLKAGVKLNYAHGFNESSLDVVKRLRQERLDSLDQQEKPRDLLKVPAKEWHKSKEYFKEHDDRFECPSKENKMKHTFILFGQKKRYAIKPGNPHGKGAFATVQILQNTKGKNYVLKSEKSNENLKRLNHQACLKRLGELKEHMCKSSGSSSKDYYVLYLRSGIELEKYLRPSDNSTRKLETRHALNIALQCAREVQRVHSKNVIHGDIKPSNLMVDIMGDRVKASLIDFGFARPLDDGAEVLSVIDKVLWGTPDYMAPEVVGAFEDRVLRNKNIIARSEPSVPAYYSLAYDIYSLGQMFKNDLKLAPEYYEQLLKTNPAERPTAQEVAERISEELNALPYNKRRMSLNAC